MNLYHLKSTLCAAVFALVSTSTSAAVLPLEERLGGLAYYDPNLGITWAAGANINGPTNWFDAGAWAASLTIGGVGGWRLPSMDVNGDDVVVDCAFGGIPGCIDNEMGFLAFEEGITDGTPGVFSNIQGNSYWSETEDPVALNKVWITDFDAGLVAQLFNSQIAFTWPVRSGDVGAVPVPAAVWLFGSALGVIGWMRREAA